MPNLCISTAIKGPKARIFSTPPSLGSLGSTLLIRQDRSSGENILGRLSEQLQGGQLSRAVPAMEIYGVACETSLGRWVPHRCSRKAGALPRSGLHLQTILCTTSRDQTYWLSAVEKAAHPVQLHRKECYTTGGAKYLGSPESPGTKLKACLSPVPGHSSPNCRASRLVHCARGRYTELPPFCTAARDPPDKRSLADPWHYTTWPALAP